MGELIKGTPSTLPEASQQRRGKQAVSLVVPALDRTFPRQDFHPSYRQDTATARMLYIELLGQIRANAVREYDGTRVSESDVASYSDIEFSTLRNFKVGLGDVNILSLIGGIQLFLPQFDDTDPRYKELLEIARRRGEFVEIEDQDTRDWLGTTKGKSYGRSIRFRRLGLGFSSEDFIKAKQLQKFHLSEHENDLHAPTPSTQREFIEALEIDPEGLIAQYLRLKAENIRPMTKAELSVCSVGELVYYLRIMRGDIQREVSQSLEYGSQSSLSRVESGLFKGMRTDAEGAAITSWLRLDEDSELAEVIRWKQSYPGQPLPPGFTTSALLHEGYLFAEHFVGLPPRNLTQEQKEQIKNKTFAGIMLALRISAGLTQKQLSERTKRGNRSISMRTIGAIENGQIPEDCNVVLLAEALDLGIHNPMTHKLLEISDEERTLRESRGKKTLVVQAA
jgi:transcriptional regulator with XRE-family HTH domain